MPLTGDYTFFLYRRIRFQQRTSSVDPVVFFQLQPIAFFVGIRSERKRMEMVNLHLADRWLTGYDIPP